MTIRFSTVYSQILKCSSLPKGSLLENHGAMMAAAYYVDCFHVVVVTKKTISKTPTSSSSSSSSPSTRLQQQQPTNHESFLSSSSPVLLQRQSPPALQQPMLPNVRSFVESFYASWTFYPESIVLWAASQFYQLPPLETTTTAVLTVNSKKKKKNGKEEPLPQLQSFGYGFFRVLEEKEQEMILDSGPTQTWMSVKMLKKKKSDDDDDEKKGEEEDDIEIEYAFGSIVKVEFNFNNSRLVTLLHQWYSKVLLAAVCQHTNKSSYY